MTIGMLTAFTALQIAPFIKEPGPGGHWLFGGRRFNSRTVSDLVDAGLAVEDGKTVRAA